MRNEKKKRKEGMLRASVWVEYTILMIGRKRKKGAHLYFCIEGKSHRRGSVGDVSQLGRARDEFVGTQKIPRNDGKRHQRQNSGIEVENDKQREREKRK